jgi:hypothetical protein
MVGREIKNLMNADPNYYQHELYSMPQNPSDVDFTSVLYRGGVRFPSSVEKTEFMELLKSNSGILSDYINAVFQNKSEGSTGSATLYNWCTTFKFNSNDPFLTLNDYPRSVAIKAYEHQMLLSGYSGFTGVSQSNVTQMGLNNILHDTMEQPAQIIGNCLRASNPSIGEPATIIAAITAALVAIITAVAAAMQTIQKAPPL